MPLVVRLAAIALAGIILSLTLHGWATRAANTPAPPASANLLFSSGFEGTTALLPPSGFYGTGAWQDIVGVDSLTGFAWPPTIWGGGATRFQLLVNAPVDPLTVDSYMLNRIETVTGHDGTPTQALYSQITQRGGGATQDPFMIQPLGETGDLYISYWVKLQPDVVQLMNPPNPNWRVLFEWKTGTQGDNGDYRVLVELVTWGYGTLSWYVVADNVASSGSYARQIYWEKYTTTTAQTLGDWMKFEVFWHRSGDFNNNAGRVWMAVNGHVIADVPSANSSNHLTCFSPCNTSMMGINNAPINRIMVSQLYTSTDYPVYQWVDDVQIWDGFPPDAAPH
jgi:hypothetical protein